MGMAVTDVQCTWYHGTGSCQWAGPITFSRIWFRGGKD
jgi:hypothetical protein